MTVGTSLQRKQTLDVQMKITLAHIVGPIRLRAIGMAIEMTKITLYIVP
jgi:hypothetical protein